MTIWRVIYAAGALLSLAMLLTVLFRLGESGDVILEARAAAERMPATDVIFMLLLFGLPVLGLMRALIRDIEA